MMTVATYGRGLSTPSSGAATITTPARDVPARAAGTVAIRASGARHDGGLSMRVPKRAQHCVHARLPAAALRLVPVEHIGIDPQGDLLFARGHG